MDAAELVESTGNELDAQGEARLYAALRHFWQPVMYAAELAERPVKVFLLGEQLVVVRLGGEVRCFPDVCVHRGTALSLGSVEGDQLRCAYHGWTYGADGACTSIPACHGAHVPRPARLSPYLVAEQGGLIWVCLATEPRPPLPEFPQLHDPRVLPGRQEPSPTSGTPAPPAVWRDYVDFFGHFAWVHDGVLGTRGPSPRCTSTDVWREGGELQDASYTDFIEPAGSMKNDGLGDASSETSATELIPTQIRYRLFMPSTVLLDQEAARR